MSGGSLREEGERDTHHIEETQGVDPLPLKNLGRFRRLLNWLGGCFRYRPIEGRSFEEIRDTLLIIATLIVAVTYPPALNPPGGLWQGTSFEGPDCSRESPCYAGKSILADVNRGGFDIYMSLNTFICTSGLFIIFILIWLPLKNALSVMVLSLLISSILICFCFAYLGALFHITPDTIHPQGYMAVVIPVYTFVTVMFLAFVYDLIHLLVYVIYKVFQIYKNLM